MKRVFAFSVLMVGAGGLFAADAAPWRRTWLDVNSQIETVAKAGGGRVVVPAGRWETKPIKLKSNV